MSADRWEHADAVHRALLRSIDLDGPPGVDPEPGSCKCGHTAHSHRDRRGHCGAAYCDCPRFDPADETHDVFVQGALALVSIALELRALREGAEQPTGLLYDLAHRRGDRP